MNIQAFFYLLWMWLAIPVLAWHFFTEEIESDPATSKWFYIIGLIVIWLLFLTSVGLFGWLLVAIYELI